MDSGKMGQFIAEMRKENNMTQKALAEKLHVTDKALSKWERGLSYPDISLLTAIADTLGVTTGELLNGQKSGNISEEIETTVDNALIFAEKSENKKIISFKNILALSITIILLLGIVVCSVCDLAITGNFTWSLYPISSIVFAWFIIIPPIKFGAKGLAYALTAFSVLIIPFLYLLSVIVNRENLIMPIGVRMSVVSIAYLWIVYLIFRWLKTRKIMALAFSLLLGIPLCLVINLNLSALISEPLLDLWDIISFGIIFVISTVLLIVDYLKIKSHDKDD